MVPDANRTVRKEEIFLCIDVDDYTSSSSSNKLSNHLLYRSQLNLPVYPRVSNLKTTSYVLFADI